MPDVTPPGYFAQVEKRVAASESEKRDEDKLPDAFRPTATTTRQRYDQIVGFLRRTRLALYPSRAAFARRHTFADRTMTSFWESGQYMPKTLYFIEWASALGYDVVLVRKGKQLS